MDDALRLLSWNLHNGLVPPDRSLRDTLRRRRGPAACTDKEHLISGMLPREGGFAIMLQETGIATWAEEMHMAAVLRDKGYTPFFSSWLAETGATSTSRGEGLLNAVSSKYVAEHEVLSLTENRPREGHGPEDPHGRGRPHPHQRPRTAGRLLPMGRKGGFLGRHTNVCHGAQPRWETSGGHRRRHQRQHGGHHKPGH